MRTKFHGAILGMAAGVALAAWPTASRAQGNALSVGNLVPVTNAVGWVLKGNNGDPDNSCRVEIRKTHTGGTILAPTNGQLETFNALVTNSYLGQGTLGINPGRYSVTFNDRLPTNVTYYARVFDRPDPATAIYYADTAPFSAPSVAPSINPEFGALKLLSGEEDIDTDGDGIPDALEDGEFSTSPSEWDTDGDGFGDWFEALYVGYMDPLDPKEAPIVLQIHSPEEPGTGPRSVSWWTLPVPGLTYRLGYRPEWVDTNGYEEVWSDAKTSNAYVEIDVENVVTNEPVKGFFRVTVPYNGP